MTSHEHYGGAFFIHIGVKSWLKSQNILFDCFTIFFTSAKLRTRIGTLVNRASIPKVMSYKKKKIKTILLFLFGKLSSLMGAFASCTSLPPGLHISSAHCSSFTSRPHRKFPSLICVGQGARMWAGSHGRAIAPMLQHIASLSPAFLFTLLAPGPVASPSAGQRRPLLSPLSWKSQREDCRRCVCLGKWPAFGMCWAKLSA